MSPKQNDLLTCSCPGTSLGDLFRRYWLPVGLSEEIEPGGKPKQLKVMGEELVLFRDTTGRCGLLGLNCPHRLCSLAYGRVEDGGIRCPFHGWLLDGEGRCLEQPAEPEPFTDKIHHPAYPCEELGGLVFAYMGPPEKKPLLPRYDVLVREDGTRKVDYYLINSNYLQNVEGALDTVHAIFLHVDHWSEVKHRIGSIAKPQVQFRETDYGIWQKTYGPDLTFTELRPLYTYFFMPAGFIRFQERPQSGLIQKYQSWYVPIDDAHTMRFQVGFAPLMKNGKRYPWPAREHPIQPGPENDYFRNYAEVDTISGIPVDAPGTSVKGFLVQDNMANETQGAIVDRNREHLGAHDKVLAAMRTMLLIAFEDVRNGRDPRHIIRDPDQNEMVDIGHNEERELLEAI